MNKYAVEKQKLRRRLRLRLGGAADCLSVCLLLFVWYLNACARLSKQILSSGNAVCVQKRKQHLFGTDSSLFYHRPAFMGSCSPPSCAGPFVSEEKAFVMLLKDFLTTVVKALAP